MLRFMSSLDHRICNTCRLSARKQDGGLSGAEMDRLGKYIKRAGSTREAKISAMRHSGRCDAACQRADARPKKESRRKTSLRKTVSHFASKKATSKKASKKKNTNLVLEMNLETQGAETDADKALWELVESLHWARDHDQTRVRAIIRLWNPAIRAALDAFVFEKVQNLVDRFGKEIQKDNGMQPEEVLGEIVGRGRDFYDKANATLVQRVVAKFVQGQDSFFYAIDVEEL